MPLITDLPTSAGVASTDYLVVDNGSTTNKATPNQILAATTASAESFTPTFSYSDGSSVSVANVSCFYRRAGAVVAFYGRFQITDVGSAGNKGLNFTLPVDAGNYGVGPMGVLYSSGTTNPNLVIRLSGTSAMVVAGAGGGYSRALLENNYYAFGFVYLAG